jgi:hypothetical protein
MRAHLERLTDEAFDLVCRLWDRYRDDQRILRLLIKARRRERRREDRLFDYDQANTRR